MQHGALGVSTSLQYVPDRFASTDEIVELAKVAARVRRHLHLASALRVGADHRLARRGVRGRRARQHSRRSVAPQDRLSSANWGRMPEVLQHFEAARARGLDVTANMYPYDRASNGLDACLPLWVRDGGLEPMLQRLKDPSLRERIKRDMDDPNAEGLGEPVVRIRRRRRRDAVVRARSVAAQMGRQERSSRSARRWARTRATR